MGLPAEPNTPTAADDRFTLRDKLGAGGMGVVYRAWDQQRGTEVALKSLRNATGRDLYRFKREFRTLADIVHPNLATLYELHTVGDEWFFTMELVEGASFLQWVRPHTEAAERTPTPGPLPPMGDQDASTVTSESPVPFTDRRDRILAGQVDLRRLDDALLQLCDGVHALHLIGKLHRDLKPSNVLVDRRGRVVLLDFGLVQEVMAMQTDQTHETAAVGTPAYMSPEQAADRSLTDASDWYSVGVMLYEALTGRRPFEGSTEQMMRRKQLDEPAAPSTLARVPAHLEQLCLRMLARDPRARPDGEEILRTLGGAPSSATHALLASHSAGPFVGRAPELAALQQALADSRRGCVVELVRGTSGMGKSALLRRFLDQVGSDPRAVVLEGRCYERESVPYKALDPVIDALTTHLMRVPEAELQALLPRGIAALARLFPVLRRVPAIAEPLHHSLQPPDPVELRRRAFGALRSLLRGLAETRPVVVAIDDVQWGDADSATFLADLVHHPEPPSLLLVACYRSEDEAGSLVVRDLRGEGDGAAEVRQLSVEALAEPDARALIEQLSGDRDAPARADAIVRESDGSPLFLTELARAAGAGGRSLDEVLISRVEGLPMEAQALLAVCSVAARPLRAVLAVRAAGLDGEGAALARLRAERLLRLRSGEGEAVLEPYHDRVREAVVGALAAPEVRAIHLALARTLEADPQADRETLVEHWIAAGEPRRAAEAAVVAAVAAEEALAFHRAAAQYAIALAHGDLTPEVRRAFMVRRGNALVNAGRLDDAATQFAEAAVGADEAERRELKRRELEQVMRRGHLDRGFEESRELLAHVGYQLPRTARRAMVSVMLQRLAVRMRGLDFEERAESQVPAEALAQLDTAWSLSSGLSFVQPIIGKSLQMTYLRRALAAGEPHRIIKAFTLELGYRSMSGTRTRDDVEKLVARSTALAERLGQPSLIGIVRVATGLASFLSGHFHESARRIADGEAYLRDHGADVRWELDLAELFRMSAMWYLGETREMARVVPIYLREATERGDVYAERGHRTWRSNSAWLAMGLPADARAHAIAAAVPDSTFATFHLHHYYQLLAHAQIDLYVGDVAGAVERVEQAWPALDRSMLRRIQTVSIESAYLRARGTLGVAAVEATSARLRLADRLARQLERSGAAWGSALALSVRAQAASLRNRPEALPLLRQAIAAFAACEMKLFAAALQRRWAQLADDEDARAAGRAGDAFMAAQAIADPEAITRMLAPGFRGDQRRLTGTVADPRSPG